MSRYVFSDLHGQYGLWEQIKNTLKEDDIAYCLGDNIDRGPRGYDITKEILEDSRITLLKGNHEDMLAEGVRKAFEVYEMPFKEFTPSNLYNSLWFMNGGELTYYNMEHLTESELLGFVKKLRELPTHITLTNNEGKIIELSHCGFDPWISDEDYYSIPSRYDKFEGYRYIWDREHIYHEWKGDKNTIVIHGHTPVQKIASFRNTTKPTVHWYADGHKVDIDLCSAVTGCAALVDIDTFEVKYFKSKVEGLFADN